MNKRIFTKANQQIILFFLFFSLIIIKSNISFAYTNYVDVKGNIAESFATSPDDPIQGIRIQLNNLSNNETYTTLTDKNGNYTIENIPEGKYSLECRYGDINVLDEFSGSPLINGLDEQDILKYNGHDYIVSDSEEQTTTEYKKLDKNAAQIFFVIDISGSMEDPITNKETGETSSRLEVVKSAAKKLAKSILDENNELEKNEYLLQNPEDNTGDENNDTEKTETPQTVTNLYENNLYIGLVSFDADPYVAFDSSTSYVSQDLNRINAEIDKLKPGSNTQVSKALDEAAKIMDHNNKDGIKIVIFLSDGLPTEDYANVTKSINKLMEQDIRLYSLLIVEDAMGMDKLDNIAELEKDEFDNTIEFNEAEDLKYEVFTPFNPPSFYYINNWYYWYSYHGYLRQLYELYAIKEDNIRMVFKETANDLANCMTQNIKTWIEEKIIEFNDNGGNTKKFDDLDWSIDDSSAEPECGWEDEERRSLVDYYFSDVFRSNSAETYDNMTGQSYLFRILDDAEYMNYIKTNAPDELKNFSEHTYMTLTLPLINISRFTTDETINIKLKRRNRFTLLVSNKAIHVRVTLSTGQVVYKDVDINADDPDSIKLFFRDIDPELMHGAFIEIEYKVSIKNLSQGINCTYLELASYLPSGLYLSENDSLISYSDITNYDTGWAIASKNDLIDRGYITHKNADLLNRYIATYSSKILLKPGDEHTTHFVLSTYVTDIEHITFDDKNVVEIIGYKNQKNRRMETVKTEEKVIAGNAEKISYLTGVYPGDGDADDPDYAMDKNSESIIPPTGSSNNIPQQYIIYAIIILSSIAVIIIIKLKK